MKVYVICSFLAIHVNRNLPEKQIILKPKLKDKKLISYIKKYSKLSRCHSKKQKSSMFFIRDRGMRFFSFYLFYDNNKGLIHFYLFGN
jgi:hypothetical protein